MKRYYFFGFPWELLAAMAFFGAVLLLIVYSAYRKTRD